MKLGWSQLVVVIACLTLAALHIVWPPNAVLTWDIFGYYLYLPAHFIYNDLYLLDQTWLDHIMQTYEPSPTLYQIYKMESGGWVIKYSLGMAVFYSPFFFIAHWLAPMLGFAPDGFSLPYQYMVAAGTLCYVFGGLILLRKLLLKFFSDGLTALVLAIIVFGTNYFQMTGFNGLLFSHNVAFLLYTVVLLATVNWHNNPRWPVAFLLGAAMGSLTLVRPSEAILVLIPILYGVDGKEGLKTKLSLIRNNFSHVLNTVFGGLLAVAPQLIYWKNATGNWFHYSYNNPGEGFDFLDPYTLQFLFSFRKGWLIYTPVMVFGLIGFWALWKYQRKLFWGFLLFFIVNLWVVSSWTCWWYAGASFSSRSLIPVYAVLSIPLGYFILDTSRSKWRRRIVLTSIGLFIALNIFQTYQFQAGILDGDRMTRAYYFRTFGKTKVSEQDRDLLLVKRPTSRENEKLEHEDRYTRELWGVQSFDDQPNGALRLSSENLFSPAFERAYKELTPHDHVWIRLSAELTPLDSMPTAPPLVVLHFSHKGKAYQYNAVPWPSQGLAVNNTTTFSVDYITPEVRSEDDPIRIYLWNNGGGNFLLDNVEVEVFQPKGNND